MKLACFLVAAVFLSGCGTEKPDAESLNADLIGIYVDGLGNITKVRDCEEDQCRVAFEGGLTVKCTVVDRQISRCGNKIDPTFD